MVFCSPPAPIPPRRAARLRSALTGHDECLPTRSPIKDNRMPVRRHTDPATPAPPSCKRHRIGTNQIVFRRKPKFIHVKAKVLRQITNKTRQNKTKNCASPRVVSGGSWPPLPFLLMEGPQATRGAPATQRDRNKNIKESLGIDPVFGGSGQSNPNIMGRPTPCRVCSVGARKIPGFFTWT